MVCPAIYPTPPACLPQKTEVGKTEVTVSGLSASTAYSVIYKRDNTIRCITTPCPENGFDSVAVEFTTVGVGTQPIYKEVRRNIRYGERGDDVVTLQKILIEKGYLRTSATGYFGVLTLKAVKDFQRAHGIISTGFVGPLTRKEL
jgi:murein L,D-transpeptidase YcbB/YkuD